MEDEKGKIIKDAIHGHIELSPVCVKIMDTPQFQRLRFLKQLGITSFVYPAASHNRFEHCLGVCHLAGRMVRKLKEHQPELQITDRDVDCVEVAGLCHDLGHGAFSHVFETFMKEVGEDFKHEEMSCKMFEHLLDDNNLREEWTDEDVNFVKDLIRGKTSEGNGRSKEKDFLFEIVSNERTGVDVDKWDYFLRDGHGLGISVTFEYERLICFSKVVEVDGERHICFPRKEMENLYEMNHSRTMLHKKAYQHRVAKVIDRMLVDALTMANDYITYPGKNRSYKLSEAYKDPEAFTLLTDDVFYQILRGPKELDEAKKILKNILSRKLYKYVDELRVTDTTTKEMLEKYVAEIEKKFPGCKCLKSVVKFGSKDGNPLEDQYLYGRRDEDEPFTLRQEQVSMMLPTRYEDIKYYVFLKDNYTVFDEVRNHIQDIKRKQL